MKDFKLEKLLIQKGSLFGSKGFRELFLKSGGLPTTFQKSFNSETHLYAAPSNRNQTNKNLEKTLGTILVKLTMKSLNS